MAKKSTPSGEAFRAELPAGVLATATARAATVAPTRTTMPIAENALLRGTGDRLIVAATNLDQGLSVTVEAVAEGAVTVPAAKLSAIASRLDPGAPVVLTMGADAMAVTITQGRSSFRLPVLPASDWPEAMVSPLGDAADTWTVDAGIFSRHLKALESGASTDEVRYYICGVFLDLDRPDPRMVVTDGYKFGLIEIADLAPPRRKGLTLPSSALRPIHDIAKGAETLAIGFAEGVVTVEARGIRLRTKLIDGAFPDYARAVPTTADRPVMLTVEADRFTTAIRRAMLVAPDSLSEAEKKAKKVSFTSVCLAVTDGEIQVSARNRGGEEAADVCPCELTAGEGIEIHMNAAHLAWGIDSLGGDTLDISCGEAVEPILIRRHGDTADLRVIAPQRR